MLDHRFRALAPCALCARRSAIALDAHPDPAVARVVAAFETMDPALRAGALADLEAFQAGNAAPGADVREVLDQWLRLDAARQPHDPDCYGVAPAAYGAPASPAARAADFDVASEEASAPERAEPRAPRGASSSNNSSESGARPATA